MSLVPSARFVPNTIFTDQNQQLDYEKLQKQSRKAPGKVFDDLTNAKPNFQNKYVSHKRGQCLQPKMNQQNNQSVALGVEYQQESHEQESVPSSFYQREQLMLNQIYQGQKKKNIFLNFYTSSQEQQDPSQQRLLMTSTTKNNNNFTSPFLKQQEKGIGLSRRSSKKLQLDEDPSTHRANINPQDRLSLGKQEKQNESFRQLSPININLLGRKKFILQIDGLSSNESDLQEDSLPVKSSVDNRKFVKIEEGQTNQQQVSIARKKPFIFSQFDQTSQDQNQEEMLENQNEQPYEIMKALNFTSFQRENTQCLSLPIPVGNVCQCIIRRDKPKKGGPCQYYVYDSSLLKHILTVRQGSDDYQFIKKYSHNKEANTKVATLKSNFFGTQFNCFHENHRQGDQKTHLITITYETNILGLKGPRKMAIYLPKQPIYSDSSLQSMYEHSERMVSKFVNKTPKWNKQIGAYVLNFKGRATHSSIKNFVIVKEPQQKMLVIFGKVGKEVFNLDIRHPFSILQGISMAISSFDKKIACQ